MLQRIFFVLLMFLMSQLDLALAADEGVPERVVILFDRSASMNAMLDGISKIEMGRQLFKQLAADSGANKNVSVRFFAGGLSSSNDENCKASSVALPFGERESSAFEALYQNLTAKGRKTPLTYAISLAKEDLVGWRGERRIVIISDGMDTCGEDPVPLADELGAGGIELDVIGLGEPADLAQLAEMGLASGAEFQLADNYDNFASAVSDMLSNLPEMPLSHTGVKSGGVSGRAGRATGRVTSNASAQAVGSGVDAAPMVPLPPDQPIVVELRMKPDTDKPEEIAVEIVLDASGSMAALLDGQTKMSLAMVALENALTSLDADNVHLGLRAYGFDESVAKTPDASCPNTELLVDFAPAQAGKLLTVAKALSPYGYTPIAASIQAAATDLEPFKKMKRQIVLITDGEETCNGDPISALKDVAGICVDVNAHIIGFDLDAKARAEMQAIAAAGCGLYLEAPNGIELEKALLEITEVVAEKSRVDWDRYVNPVTGGETLETAYVLEAGAYTFEQHLEKSEKQYFRIPLTQAQRLRLVVTAQGRLVRFDDNGNLVEQSGYNFTSFWADFLRADGSKIKGPAGRLMFRSAKPGDQEELQLLNLDEGGVYMLVHANSMRINKDTRIDLMIDDAGDLSAGYDAPDNLEDSPPVIGVLQNVVGHIGLQDRIDIYRLEISSTKKLSLHFNPTHAALRYRIVVKRGDTGRPIHRFNNLSGSQSLALSVPEDVSDLLIEVASRVPGNKVFSSYVFVVGDMP